MVSAAPPSVTQPSSIYDSAYTASQLNRSRLRKFIRLAYLRRIVARVNGPTVDFGCGVGELLARLPRESLGLEINQASIEACRRAGLEVSYYDAALDGWSLSPLVASRTRPSCLVLSHVLEHLDDPLVKLNALLHASERHGITRVVIVVPGRAGFRCDHTHRTFVDVAMLRSREALAGTSFVLLEHSWFPFNVPSIGDYFKYHELMAVYERRG